MLKTLKIRELLSFGPKASSIEFNPLNIIIGPNGSGKSNLIDVLSILQSAPREITFPLREGGGIRDWLWKGSTSPIALIDATIENPHSETPLRYVLAFQETVQRFELVDEKIENAFSYQDGGRPYFYYKFENGHPVINPREGTERKLRREDVNTDQSILAQRKDPDHYPEITYLGDSFSKIRIYREWSFGRYTPPRLPQKSDLPNLFLEETCSNLGLVLNRLRRDANTKRQILTNLKALYEGIDDYDVTIEGGTVQVFFHEGKFTIPATRLSDGTLRYLSLLTILCHPTPPPLVCIEEPELGLHPDILPTLAELLQDAAMRTQIIVTTHSDSLVDQFSDSPDSVIVCEKDEGSTILRRLTKEKLSEWLKKYTLGELWRMGEIGGKRW